MAQLTSIEFHDHSEACDGFCTTCDDWTLQGIHPDYAGAVDLVCPQCGMRTVHGANVALSEGIVEIADPVYPLPLTDEDDTLGG